MIAPGKPPFGLRIVSPMCGEALPLDDEVRRLLDTGASCLIALVGPSGAGKTTALRISPRCWRRQKAFSCSMRGRSLSMS